MIVARPLAVKNMQRLDNGHFRFTLVIFTSLDRVEIFGFIFDGRRVLAPGIPIKSGFFFPVVKFSPHLRALLRKLVQRAIAAHTGTPAPATESVSASPETASVLDAS